MTATSAPQAPDPTRSGAVWVTGTGAFLLLAAAAVFTAVRWHEIPGAAKLGALGLATGGFLVAGRRLMATLPATGATLFHLGTFLVPVDVAAIAIRAGAGWPSLLLAEGVATTLTFGAAALVERSVVLRWAWGTAVVVLACGVGATTPVPPTVVLAVAAAVAVLRRADAPALGWAAVVGLAPLATLVDRWASTGTSSLDHLGLARGDHPIAASVAALGAAAVIGAIAQRRQQVDLAVAGVVIGIVGIAGAWLGQDPQMSSTVVALAATFVGLELAALWLREDPFWCSPVGVVVGMTELAAGAAVGGLVLTALPIALLDRTDAPVAVASGLLALGWIVADRRRGAPGLDLATTVVTGAALCAVSFGTGSGLALAIALAASAVVAVAADRRDGVAVAVVAACAAPLAAWGHPVSGVAGLVGAVAIGECAVRWSRRAAVAPRTQRMVEDGAQGLAIAALVPLGFAFLALAQMSEQGVSALVLGAVAATGLAAWIDRGEPAGDLPLGTLARAGSVLALAGTAGFAPIEVALVAAVVAGLSAFDALRLRLPVLALGASIAGPIATGAFLRSTGLSLPTVGVGLAIAAVVVAGLTSLADAAWRAPGAAAVAACLLGGLPLAAAEPAALAHALLLTGGLALAAGVVAARVDVQIGGSIALVLGFWMRLGASDVHASEPYLLPVAVLFVAAGTRTLARGAASSWVAYGPSIALLGGAALLERTAGGPGWHAVVAGAVGVLAVVIGGDRRLAGPLVLGTVLLVALSAYETLAITAGLPTWMWLALGGSTLLAAGVAMERHDLGPLETGRRLVDVVAERYR